jgi:hypothetical protein
MPKVTAANAFKELFDYLLNNYETKIDKLALRKWGVFFKLFSLADKQHLFSDEAAARQINENKILANAYLKEHKRGEFSDFVRQISEFDVSELRKSYAELSKEVKFQEIQGIQALKVHVISDDFESARHVLEKYSGDWEESDKNREAHKNARLLRKAVKNVNPQMIALLLAYDIPDMRDKYGVNAQDLASAKPGERAQTYKAQLFKETMRAPNWHQSYTCSRVFELAELHPLIKHHLFLFIIEDYFAREWPRTENRETYERNMKGIHTFAEARNKFDKKYGQFVDILKLIATEDHPQEALRRYYIDQGFKKPTEENSHFRKIASVLTAFDDAALKKNVGVFFKAHGIDYDERFVWDEQYEALSEAMISQVRKERLYFGVTNNDVNMPEIDGPGNH